MSKLFFSTIFLLSFVLVGCSSSFEDCVNTCEYNLHNNNCSRIRYNHSNEYITYSYLSGYYCGELNVDNYCFEKCRGIE